jgi:hypothetical protein
LVHKISKNTTWFVHHNFKYILQKQINVKKFQGLNPFPRLVSIPLNVPNNKSFVKNGIVKWENEK